MPADVALEPAGGLPPRRETILARYPRKLKIAALAVLLILLASPLMFSAPKKVENKLPENMSAGKPSSKTQSADRMAQGPMARGKGGTSGAEVALNAQDDRTIKLAAAPDPELTEDTSQGGLPRVGKDGRQPWQVYARPYNTMDKRPRIAIVVADLGLSRLESDAVIARLPATVTLAFDVQSPVASAWCGRARQDGHETLLAVPMEPFDYPRSDPGPNTLLTTLPNSDNLDRLMWALRQGTGYVGITSFTGSRFTTSPEKMRPILNALKDRGLMIFDARVAPHSVVYDMAHDARMPVVEETHRLDQDLTPDGIDKAFDQLEKDARVNGSAVAVTAPVPLVIEKLQLWLKDLPARGISLAPLTAMVQ